MAEYCFGMLFNRGAQDDVVCCLSYTLRKIQSGVYGEPQSRRSRSEVVGQGHRVQVTFAQPVAL